MTKTNNIVAKLSVAVVAVAMAFALVAPAAKAQDVSSMSLEQLIALVNSLQSQLSGSGSMSGSCSYTFTRSLSQGSTGADVMNLQKFLNMSADTQVAAAGSAGGPGSETSYYGPATAAAVSKFQVKYSADILVPVGLTSPTGYFGPSTMAKANSVCSSTDGGSNGGTSSGDLEGGVGSITVDDSSEYSAEEVGEGEDDVEVMEFMVEAGDDSDVRLTSLKVEFVESGSTSSEDLDDYADEVTVWYKGDKVGSADADDFDESSDVWTKTISLDDVVIRAGDEEAVVIAVSALSNLDSGDIDSDAWTVDVLNIRFVDGDGVTTTESTDGNALEKTFDFTDFASAADLNLKISNGDDEINDARSINIDDTDNTDNVEVFSFMMEAEGDSDVMIKDLPVTVTTVGADVDDISSTLYLYADGEKIGTESTSAATTTVLLVTFDDLDYTIDAGDEVEFVVKAKIKPTSGTLDDGDTIQVSFGEAETDNAAFDAEDEEGEDIADADVTGSAAGDAHELRDAGIMVSLVGTPTATLNSTASTTAAQSGTFTITFDVTAFDSDVYIDKTDPSEGGTINTGGADETDINATASSTSSAIITSPSGATEGTDGFLVDEGQTERFTVTINATALSDGFVAFSIGNIAYALTDADATTGYTFNLEDFKTPNLFLND